MLAEIVEIQLVPYVSRHVSKERKLNYKSENKTMCIKTCSEWKIKNEQ